MTNVKLIAVGNSDDGIIDLNLRHPNFSFREESRDITSNILVKTTLAIYRVARLIGTYKSATRIKCPFHDNTFPNRVYY